jgi:hypothetical protein
MSAMVSLISGQTDLWTYTPRVLVADLWVVKSKGRAGGSGGGLIQGLTTILKKTFFLSVAERRVRKTLTTNDSK